MAKNTAELIKELYETFRGLPNSKPIVRNDIENDAYTLAILQLVYGKDLGIDMLPENIDQICKYVVAPPDSGIDLFVEIEDGDEYYYHIIQSKYSELNESEILACYTVMSNAIKDYLKDPTTVHPNLRSVISKTNFGDSYKNNCSYFVYHKGLTKHGNKIKNKVDVVNTVDLDIILQSINNPTEFDSLKVPYEELHSDAIGNYMLYEPNSSNKDNPNEDSAILCSIRGYDLARLCEKYYSTSKGRNILFGQNLRESLAKKSKTSSEMKKTIDNEPKRFWHYNNGITIIAETVDLQKKDESDNSETIILSNFSIINGAQTTSALREYLEEAESKFDDDAIERLKNVYVLARLMQITSDKKFGNNIAIFNNSQNAISSRDMVANNTEQLALQKRYMDGGKPNIYIGIRNGSVVPSNPRFEKHQRTTNEELAQLAFAAFLQEPFSAKDKKAKMFTKDHTKEGVLVNENYQRIFNYDTSNGTPEGILFKKNKYDIDELLFIKHLYREARSKQRNYYENRIEKAEAKIKADPSCAGDVNPIIASYQRNKEISNTCMFYCIALYYAVKDEFEESTDGTFDYTTFYGKGSSTYRSDIINYFADNFLIKTISIINNSLGAEGNVGNWVRRKGSEKDFLTLLSNEITLGAGYNNMYRNFVEKFKTVTKE